MGYAGVETSGIPGEAPVSTADAARIFSDLGLPVTSLHTQPPIGDAAQAIIEAAHALNAPCIVTGKGPADYASLDAIKRTCELLNRANEVVRAAGLAFAVHNHWWEFIQVEGRYVYEAMLDYLDPTVGFQLDTYWIQTAGVDPATVVRRMGARSPLLHIKDGPCVQGQPMTAVGDGVVNVPAIVQAGAPHTQWLIVEIDRCATDMYDAVARSARYLMAKGLGRGASA